jgi:hypothetical protein
MQSQTLINILEFVLLLVAITALILGFWMWIPVLATVSWNG